MFNSAIAFKEGRCCYQQHPLPTFGKGLHIKVLSAGLCGTDIQILNGTRHEETDIIGHEGMGIVANDYVSQHHSFNKGQHVIINPTDAKNPAFLLGHNTPGLFQEYVIISDEAVSNDVVLSIDASVSTTCAALIEPVAVALTALDAVQSRKPQRLVIIGGGIVGNLIGIIATLRKVYLPVIIIHHSVDSLAYSKTQLLPMATHLVGEASIADSLSQKGTAVFITTPRNATHIVTSKVLEQLIYPTIIDVIGGFDAQELINRKSAIALYENRATNVCTEGKNMHSIAVFPTYSDNPWLKDSIIVSHRGVANAALLDALALIHTHQPRFQNMITHTYPFLDFVQFLNTLITSETRIIDDRYVLKSVMLNNKDLL